MLWAEAAALPFVCYRAADVFNDFGVELPAHTRWLLWSHWAVVAGLMWFALMLGDRWVWPMALAVLAAAGVLLGMPLASLLRAMA